MLSSSLNSLGAMPQGGILSGFNSYNPKPSSSNPVATSGANQNLPPPPSTSHTGVLNNAIAGGHTVASVTHNADGSATTKLNAPVPPEYDTTTGLLTDYGRSIGAADVNGAKKTTTTPSPTQSAPQATPTYAGLIGQTANASANAANTGAINYGTANTGLLNSLSNNDAIAKRAQDIASAAGQKISDIGGQGARGQAGYLTTGTSPVGEGNAAVLAQTTAAQQQAVSQGAQTALQGTAQGLTAQGQTQSGFNNAAGNALNSQGQGITGLGNAAGVAAPIQVPYSNQLVNPATGQPYGGGSTGSLQDAVSSVVQRLQNGTMGYNDALTALSGYGQGGINALQAALPPGFNIAQSNTLAGQQGTIGPAYDFADKALTNVETLMSQLPSVQNTNIPGVNAVTQGFSTLTGLGSEQTRAVTGAVQTSRNAYAALLASARGGTPTDYSGQAQAEIPDKPTPNDIAAIRKNFETLGAARKQIYGNPGQANQTTNGTSNNIYSF